jgi:hypothetical protein
MEVELRRLLDEEAIKKVHLRYCRGIDRMDWDLVRSCYHPDALDDHGEFVGDIEAFIEYGKANLPTFLSTSHCICNQLVEVDGDTAFAEHYGIAYHRLPAGEDGLEKDWIATIRYIDRFERRDSEWRIAHRRSIVDSDRVTVVSETLIPRGSMAGSRDRNDPSYER